MKRTIWTLEKVFGRTLARQTRQHLAEVAAAPVRASRARTMSLLRRLIEEPGPHVLLGHTDWGQAVLVPLEHLVVAHSIATGGTGSGKTMSALALIEAILALPEPNLSFGVLDAKGELFERTLFLLARRLQQLPPHQAEALRQKIVIIDLASQDPLTSYNIARPWSGSDLDFFANSRMATLQELLPSGDGFSLRGSSMVKHVLMLLAERQLPFSYFDRVLSSETFRAKLLARSAQEDLRYYFRFHFPNEGKAAIAAVRARLVGALLGSLSLKLALSGQRVPDFRELMDTGKIVLINCAGPNIPRNAAETLQSLFISDIRAATFSRTTRTPYLWVCDEAQNFFRTRQLRENMTDLLRRSRSYGTYLLCLTQNLGSALQDGDMLETLHTNIKWSFSMRSTPRDCAFLQPALPITGRMPKPRINPYAPPEFYSLSEERAQVMAGLAHLPDRTGWLWLKSLTGEAMRIRTKTLDIPEGEAFKETVGGIHADARIGQRVTRSAYLAEMAERDAEYAVEPETDTVEQLKKSYREDRSVGK
jgi:hypothetical protein